MNNNIERAHIFQSFDALKGLRELLKAQEVIKVPFKSLSEDELERLDYAMRKLEPGMMVSVIYYHEGSYYKITGRLAKINRDTRFLQIVKTRLNFNNIADITISSD